MWIVEVETRSFTFRAVGDSEAQAREALRIGWEHHCRQTGAEPDYIDPREDGNAVEVQSGECWRDDAVIVSNGITRGDAV